MITKKSVQSRIRGWFPQETYFAKLQKTENPMIIVGRNSWGLRVLTVMFWFFGLAEIFSFMFQTFEFSYLPSNLRFFMSAVSVANCSGVFIVGAGLLTTKRRWIDVAIIFCAASVVVFHFVPLRSAFPFEIIAIVYLVYVRMKSPIKQPLTKANSQEGRN